MKYLLISICLLAFFSCNQDNSIETKNTVNRSSNIQISDNTNIFGNWVMCSTDDNGIMTQMNVCPTVSFFESGLGSVGVVSTTFDSPPSNLEYFRWNFKKGILTIVNYKPTQNSTFSDTTYSALITKKSNKSELVIYQVSHGYSFYLSK